MRVSLHLVNDEQEARLVLDSPLGPEPQRAVPPKARRPHLTPEQQEALLREDLRALFEQLQDIARFDLDDNPTPSPIEAWKMYVGSRYALKLNRYLRGESSEYREALEKMNAGMLVYHGANARTLQAPVTMRRWIRTTHTYSPIGVVPGTTVTERGWLSLSTLSSHGFFTERTDVEYDIDLPIGSRVMAGSLREREFVLAPHSTFLVQEVVDAKKEIEGKKKYLINLELIVSDQALQGGVNEGQDESGRGAECHGRPAVLVRLGDQGVRQGGEHGSGGEGQRQGDGLVAGARQGSGADDDGHRQQHGADRPDPEDEDLGPALLPHGGAADKGLREVGDEDRRQQRQPPTALGQ